MANPEHLAILKQGVEAFPDRKDHDAYQKSFVRLVADLKAEESKK
jgi:hypothetical protein